MTPLLYLILYTRMKIATRNVNGIRAIADKWFAERLLQEDIDILCIQEPKAFVTQIPPTISHLRDTYEHIWHESSTPGYAGSAIIYKKSLWSISWTSYFEWHSQLMDDGRTTEIIIWTIKIINCYFPNWSPRADGREMLWYKLSFYETMVSYIQSCQKDGFEVIVTGDFNICHREIDIARPKENEHSIGFLPIEREKIWRLMESCGLTDVFRHFYPDLRDKYTRWSYRAGARPRNVWRRLDYMMASPWLITTIDDCIHYDQTPWSDHCPVMITLTI